MAAPALAAPHSHSGLRFRNRLNGALRPDLASSGGIVTPAKRVRLRKVNRCLSLVLAAVYATSPFRVNRAVLVEGPFGSSLSS